jgi:hypothetical protein
MTNNDKEERMLILTKQDYDEWWIVMKEIKAYQRHRFPSFSFTFDSLPLVPKPQEHTRRNEGKVGESYTHDPNECVVCLKARIKELEKDRDRQNRYVIKLITKRDELEAALPKNPITCPVCGRMMWAPLGETPL